MSKILFDEHPLVIPIKTAEKLGLEKAIIIQQVHYWLQEKEKGTDLKFFHDGRYWIYNTYDDWRNTFPFWSVSTIRRKIGELEKSGILLSANYNENATMRKKWYSIDYEKLEKTIHPEQMEPANMDKCNCSDVTNASAQNEQMEMSKVNSSNNIYKEDNQTKTTSKTTSETSSKEKLSQKTDTFAGHTFSEPMQEAINDWLSYKKERHEAYKPTGKKMVLSEIENKLKIYNENDVINTMRESMSNNWKGICWDKLKGKEKPHEPKERPIPPEILRAKEEHEKAMKRFKEGKGKWEDLIPE